MKKFYTPACSVCRLLVILMFLAGRSFAGVGDTTIVQTLRFDTTMRAGVFMFPDDSTKTYEKIIMLYSMRCKNGLISTGQSPNLGCGEWDYNCYTYVVDSTQTDSLVSHQSSYGISNFSDTVFDYTAVPVWAYTQYNQQEVTYTSVISEDSAIVGSGTTSLSDPFGTANALSRTQYIWTAAELTAAGLTAGDVTGMKLDLLAPGSQVDNLRIRIRHSIATVLDENNPQTDSFTEVYFLNTTFSGSGIQPFNFHTPFTWDGTSSLLVDFSFTNASTGTGNDVQGDNVAFNAGLVTSQPDGYLNGLGEVSLIRINPAALPTITDKVTVAFWAYGDTAKLPSTTVLVEGHDSLNRKQINIHLPWSDSNIYWDCGNDGSGYDRINKAAVPAEFEGKWNFWAFTKNAVTGVMNIYLNGTLWATGTGKTRMIDIEKMVAGVNINGNYYYKGGYDELSLWNTDLSPASIQQIMYKDISASHPDYANLLAYYKLNEGTGNIATDASSNLFDSEIINPAWRNHRGNTVFRNFTATTMRPNTIFVKGVYTTSVQTFPVLDSVIANNTSVISFGVVNNILTAIDTIYVWPSGYSYTYDAAGIKIDSIAVATQNSISVTQLDYYQKRAMRLELINFITPYGINLNLDGLNGKTWAFDVTDYAPVLKGARYLAMEDGKYQEDNDIKFVFYEGTPPRDVKSISQIWPNGSWVFPSYNDIVSNKYFELRNVPLSASASQFKIRSAISGHGQEGEFIARNHTITLNGSINYTRQVWKTCGDNPIYPQGGTWVYDRAGWCPGAVVDTKEYEITGNVSPGATITLDYSLPAIGNPGSSTYRINNQLVSYGAANFTLDAAVDYIKTPSKRVEFQRLSPICNSPVIAIKNTGSSTLTALDITYGRVGGTMSVYHWSGSLGFLESAEVTLPAPNWFGTNINEFVAYVGNPNGSADQYAHNDTMRSTFDIPASYPSGLIFEIRTNNFGFETAYTVKDALGNFILNKNFLGNNITYKDTVYLATDCYTFELTDQGGDGLAFWANPAQGSGICRIRNAANNAIIKSFNGDFGNRLYQQFSINYSLPVEEPVVESIDNLTVSPNPAADIFTASFSLPQNTRAKISLVNMLGEVLQTETVVTSLPVEKVIVDISKIENGLYYVVLQSGNASKTQKLVIAR